MSEDQVPANVEQPTDDELEARLNESLEQLPPPSREVIKAVMQIEARHHQGPLPPASELVAYENALPGLAREIVDNAKAEQNHRHSMDARTGNQEFILNLVGLAATIVALILMLAIVGYMVHEGAPVAASGFGGAIIVGVVVALTNYNKSDSTPMPKAEKPAEKDKKEED